MTIKVTQLTYARGATVNTGNSNNIRHDISVTVEIEGDNPDEAFGRIKDWAKAKLKACIAEAD